MTTIADRLQTAGPGWIVLGVAALALLAMPILRRLLPRGRRHRGGGAVLFLGVSVMLSASAILLGGMAGASLGTLVQVVSVLTLGIGLVAIAGLVVFDLVLARVGVAVPSILRDLLVRSGVAYGHPPGQVRGGPVAAVRGVPGVLEQPPPDRGPHDFGESAIGYGLRYWSRISSTTPSSTRRSGPVSGTPRSAPGSRSP